MFNSLADFKRKFVESEYQITTNVSIDIDTLFNECTDELFELVGEKVFGDYVGYVHYIEVEVYELLGCDLKNQTVEVKVCVTGMLAD